MCLAILGEVFDVSTGKRFYGVGEGYAHFVGRDASRAFITGRFQDDLTDDVSDFTNEQMASLSEWRQFYRSTYRFKGRVEGAFYNEWGEESKLLKQVAAGTMAAKTQEEIIRESESQYPRCNVRWNEKEGGLVYCSGEGQRPRKIFVQLPGGKPAARCACMQGDGWSDVRQVYPGCPPSSQTCQTQPPEPRDEEAAAAEAEASVVEAAAAEAGAPEEGAAAAEAEAPEEGAAAAEAGAPEEGAAAHCAAERDEL